MQKYSDVVQDTNGNAVVGASVTIKLSADDSTATIYSTNTGTAQSNPITTDSDGRFTFYAKDGTYYAAVSRSGVTAENGPSFTLTDISGFVSASGYGVVADGSTDDTTALQAAITASYGKTLMLPAGTIKVTSGLSITSAIRLLGQGRDETYIQWTSTTLNVFSVASAAAVHFEQMCFAGPASATAGAVISIAHSSSGTNYFSTFQDCTFSNGYDQIKTSSAAAWTVRNCYFSAFVHRAITVTNSNQPDVGDSFVTGCVFSNGIAGSVGIYQTSSGGLKVIGNKFNGLGSRAYQMQLASGVSTSILIFANNSVENHTVDAMKFDTDGGGAGFSQVVISGNQFALTPYFIDMSTASSFLTVVTITGNSFTLNGSGTYCINMGAIARYSITGNNFYGTGGTPTGILLGASCTGGQIGPNNYQSITTPVNDSSTSKSAVYFNSTQVSANGVQFPATQVASSDANCLDDYEEGTWTPALTFGTAGDLSVAYTTQVGSYVKIGKRVFLDFNIVTSAFTHTTASGSLTMTGLPFTALTLTGFNYVAPCGFQGITKAGYTQVGAQIVSGLQTLTFYASGSGVSGSAVAAADVPTGGTVVIRGQVTFTASA